MNRLRVLKLGWEFPPLINGGLGIACLGLARALAKHVELTVVVPQSSPEADFTEFDLCGVNLQSLETLKPAEGRYRYESFAQVRNVPVFLDPYGGGEIANDILPLEIFSETTAQQLASFKPGDPYGPDLAAKVMKVYEESIR